MSLVESARLPHPLGPLLESYVSEALNPVSAAQYIEHRLQLGEAASLVDDWSYIIESIAHNGRNPPRPGAVIEHAITKRDGGKCCVTGKPGTLRDPLIVAPIIPIPEGWDTDKTSINDMLGAFFSPPYRDWWLSYIKNPKGVSPNSNHWSVRKSAAKAFASGLVKLDRLHPSMIEYKLVNVSIEPEEPVEFDGEYPLLGDHSRSGIVKVDPRFIGSQARLRVLYKTLQRRSNRLHGRADDYPIVQRLPFGLYLKCNSDVDSSRNEFSAIEIVRRHTSIPVPKALDIVVEQADTTEASSWPRSYLLTTEVPGFPLSRCQDVLSEKDMERIANQLKDYVAQLRDIPRSTQCSMAICNTLGEACRDPRICSSNPVGPFADEASFSQMLRFSDEPARRGHKIVFTHADLNPRNILVGRIPQPDGSIGWSVTGIVDWETAGYYPEYWEYTKAMFERFRWTRRYNDFVHGVFSEFGDYSQEFDVEKRSWESGDGI
ncbi:hypothetical protein Daesc_007917 [Daldinia eschscholtzii]|uniref:Aminoglycoside phosphotransferase domain-containing protein n=1 Tax=Daldinia eschscholtzii TaxID=292717 RepID=A0AAX6MGU0_9PEZI